MTYGGIVQKLTMPDKNGKFADIVLGFDNLDGYISPAYVKSSPYFGALIGRYGNRIGGAKFTLEGQTYTLATNNGPNSLHGGIKGFDKVVWKAVKANVGPEGPRLDVELFEQGRRGGFPRQPERHGDLHADRRQCAEADLHRDDRQANRGEPHATFLFQPQRPGQRRHPRPPGLHQFRQDHAGGQWADHDRQFADVTGTPFDFRKPTAIGARINDPDPVLQYGPGYDHNWVINKPPGQFGLMARVTDPVSGRVMEVWSDQPGLQFYAGNFLDGTLTGKGGKVYQRRSAFCMEPQHYPDSPNQPNFPPVELKPGQTYHNTIVYKFSVE